MFQSVLHFPIWQGAGGRYGYGRGAGVLRAIAAQHLPVVDVAVDDQDFSPAQHKVVAYDTLKRHFAKAEAALAHMPAPVMVIGGDCVSDFVSIARALQRHGEKMALLWIDAHPDINTPETSPSGNFHGMLVRTLMGEGPEELAALAPVKLHQDQLFYVGIREDDMDAEEFRIIEHMDIQVLSVAEAEAGRFDGLLATLHARGFTHLYIHLDSDVLNLTDYPQAVVAVPGGLKATTAVSLLRRLRAEFPLAGGALTEYSLEVSAGAAEIDLGRQLLVDGFGI